jgi:ATP-dependent Clp protease ATP-binding subunit ClpX
MAASGLVRTVPSGPYTWNVGIVPDGRFVTWLAGGNYSLGILTPKRLAAATRPADAASEESDCAVPAPLPAKTIRDRIAEKVVGLDGGQLDVVAGRLALHMARAKLLAAGHDPGTPNEVILVLGESGTGKTFLCETAGQVTGLPFGICNAAELTLTGYVGLNADAGLLGVIQAARGRVDVARFGLCCYDEVTKRAASTNDSTVTSTGVLNELLRIVQGQVTQVNGKRSNYDPIYWLNTTGMFFFLAGHAPGLDRLIERRQGRKMVGFGTTETRKAGRGVMLDALEDYGLTAELVNRLTAVVALPPPRLGDLITATTSKNGVIASYNKLLAARRCVLQLDDEGVREMAEHCIRSRLYYRGLSAIVSGLAAQAVRHAEGLTFVVGADGVRRIVGKLDEAAEDLLAHKRAAPADEDGRVMQGPERLAASTG